MGPAPVRSRHLVVALSVALAALAVSGPLAATHDVSEFERGVAQAAYDLPRWSTPAWRVVMQAGTQWAIAVVALALVVARRRSVAVAVAGSAIVAWGIGQVGKALVGRNRPTELTLGRQMRDVVGQNGYPSTHTAVAVGLAAALIIWVPMPRGWRIAAALVAVGVGVARIHVTAHWPLDVVGGGAIGVAVACGGGLLAQRRADR